MTRRGQLPAPSSRRRAAHLVREWEADCGELENLAARLRRMGPLISRAAIPAFDGFGPGRGFDAGPTSGGSSDPVGDAAARRIDDVDQDIDPVGTAVSRMRAQLAVALVAARRSDNARLAATRIPAAEHTSDDDRPGCVNCARFDVWSAPVKASRCWACYGYRARHDGRDAPEQLVLTRPEVAGKRRMIRAE